MPVFGFSLNHYFKLLKRRLPGLLMACALVLCGMRASAQAPRFSYPAGLTNGAVFPTGTAISFTPTQLGGAIPANTFATVQNFSAPPFNVPGGVATDGAGNFYVANSGANTIMQVNSAGMVSTLAGSGTASETDGTGVGASFNLPFAITYSGGVLYVADQAGKKVRKIVISTKVVTTIAGCSACTVTSTGDGNNTVAPLSAHLDGPDGIAIDPAGNIYIADEFDAQIRIINASTGMLSLFAGNPAGPTGTDIDGVGTAATFNSPSGIVIDPTGNYLYVVDNIDGVIRRIIINAAAGTVGTVLTLTGKAAATGTTDGIGTAVRFGGEILGGSLAIDASGNLYVGDTQNNTIRLVTPAGEVFTIAGSGTKSSNNGVGTAATFSQPLGTVWDPKTGNIFVLENTSTDKMREITGTGYFIEGINATGTGSVALPAGLTFTSSTGVLSGTPNTSTATATYAIMGFNVTNATTRNSYYTTVSIGVGATFTWTGASGTTTWATPANWTPNGPPGTNDIAIIPSVAINTPTINTASPGITINKLMFTNIGAGSTPLTMATGSLLTVNGSITLGANATISGTGAITLAPTATLAVGSNTLTLNGIVAFTLQSNATSSASVAAMTVLGIVGPGSNLFTVQRYLQGGILAYRGYRLLSSPVNTGTGSVSSLNYLNTTIGTSTGIPVSGPGGTTNGFNVSPFNNPSLFEWQENIAGTQATFFSSNYRAVSSLSAGTTMPIGNGFLAFSRGSLLEMNATTITTVPTAAILGATGTLNQGSVQVHLWYQPSLTTFTYTTNVSGASVPFPGYVLIGNPYASSIDWDTFQTTTANTGIYSSSPSPVSSSIKVLDPVSHNYGTYIAGNGGIGTLNATNVIASGQGFFVVAASVNQASTLQFNETAKIQTQNVGFNLLESTSAPTPVVLQYLRLRLAADSVNTDETMLRFTNTVTGLAYNKNTDATYLPGNGIESLASLSSDKVAVAIKALPLPGLQSQNIGLVVNAASDGLYTLGLHDIVAVPQLYQVWLKDALAKDSLDLRSNAAYAFNITHADTGSYGSHRFSLVIRQNPALGLHLLSFAATKATTGALITWVTENEANYTNFTLQRSTDNGVSFTTIGGFASTSAGAYSFTDANPAKPADQYRLQLTDVNGTITYSAIVTLGYNNQNSIAGPIVIYPNPTKGLLNVSITQALGAAANQSVGITTPTAATGKVYGIKIISITGLVVKTATTTQATWQTDISSLAPGTYIVQVVDSSNNNLIGKGQFIKL